MAEEQEQPKDDEFQDGWDEANSEPENTELPDVESGAEEGTQEQEQETTVVDNPETNDAGGADDIASANAEEEEENDLNSKYEKLEQNFRTTEGRLKAEATRANDLQQKLEATEKRLQEFGDLQTKKSEAEAGGDTTAMAEADEDIEAFYDEYPELRGTLDKLVDKMVDNRFQQFEKKVSEKIDPVVHQSEVAKQTEWEGIVYEKHNDWKDIIFSEDLEAYINEQPLYIANGIRSMLENASPEETIDLIDRYKVARGKSAATSDGFGTDKDEQAEAKKQQLAEKRRQQAADATAVHGRRTNLPKGEKDPNDFEGGWNEANSKQ